MGFYLWTRGDVGEWAGKSADLRLCGRMTCIDETRGDLEEWPYMDETKLMLENGFCW